MKFPISLVLFWCLVGMGLAGCGVIGPGLISQNRGSQSLPEKSETLAGEWEQLNQKLGDAKADLSEFKYDQAIQGCTEILNRPWSRMVNKDRVKNFKAAAYFIRAQAFAGKGLPLIAMDDLDDAVDYGDEETKPLALVERARVALALNRWTRSVDDCTSAIRLRPDLGQAYLVRSQALSAAGKADLARISLGEAERLGIRTTFKIPLKVSAFDQATEQLQQGHPGIAIELLSQALSRGNNSWQINGLLAQAQYDVNEYPRAIIASNRALKLNPEFVDGYKIRGLSHFEWGDYDAAIVDFQSTIDLDESTAAELAPYIAEAAIRGGMAPEFRIKALSQIRDAVSKFQGTLPAASASEQWLLELNAIRSSSDQIAHLQNLLTNEEVFSPDNLSWLAEYLVLNRRPDSVRNLRLYLQRQLGDEEALSESERYLRDLTATRSASVAAGVNLFSDQVAYAVYYDFNHILQVCVEGGDCRVNADHASQALSKDDPTSLRILLPATSLLNQQVQGLLKQAMLDQKTEQVRLLINRYNGQLTAEISEFLGVTP